MIINNIRYKIARLLNRRPCAIRNSVIDKTSSVGNGAQVVESTVGRYSYVYNSGIICTDIGNFCSIAENCTIGGGKHPVNWVSTSPVFYRGKNTLRTNFSENSFAEFVRTKIGNDVWIGSRCLIKGGVSIGDGAIIGMGSIVTHDVPPYEIWGGNPAHFIRKRFNDEMIQSLLKTKWWELPDDELSRLGNLFNNPESFIHSMGEENR